MKSLAITAITVLLLGATAGYAQSALQSCLQAADKTYKNDWAARCPTGPGIYQHNYPLCKLPRFEAGPLNNDLRAAQNDCYQANAAGLFTDDGPIEWAPGTRPDPNAAPLPEDPQPRRKFWISPQ